MMKVCDVVVDSVWHDPRVKKQIYSYIDKDCELECVGIEDERYNKEEVDKIPCKINLLKIRLQQNKRSIFDIFLYYYNLNLGLYKMIRDSAPDVIHANDLNALIPAYFASKKLKSKLIYDTHEIWLENNNIVNKKLLRFVYSIFEKNLIHKVDRVVCVSNAAAEYFVRKYNIPKPLVVTNCISKERQNSCSYNKSVKKELLNHGQFYHGRGYDIMIEAAPELKKFNDVEIVLRGFGAMEKQMRDRASELVADNVRFAPPVTVDELIPEATRAWVGFAITEPININFEMSVSNKIFEYAAAGLPVIMSDIPEHRYLNEKYQFGIILKKDTPEEIVKAVETFYYNSDFYDKCAENSERLSSEINWDNEFDKLFICEQELLDNFDK